MYVSMVLSQFVPPFPSHTVSNVCSLCLCLYSCPANRFISTIFLDSTTQQSHYWAYPEKTIIEKDTCTPVFTVALFTIARTWKHLKMSIDRWMDKEVVVHIYNRILLSRIKEHIKVSSSEMDEPRICYTEWSKSEREKQILYINAFEHIFSDIVSSRQKVHWDRSNILSLCFWKQGECLLYRKAVNLFECQLNLIKRSFV